MLYAARITIYSPTAVFLSAIQRLDVVPTSVRPVSSGLCSGLCRSPEVDELPVP